MLEVKNICKNYKKKSVLKDISFTIENGSICGLMGENGAGKSTLMKIIAGLLKCDSGEILYDGKSIFKNINSFQKNIGYMPDFFGVYDNLKVTEYLLFFAGLYGIYGDEADERCLYLLDRLNLSEVKEQYVDFLSRGMKQRLCLARCLMHKPKILILDEPCSGMDSLNRTIVKQFLMEEAEAETMIFISSHVISDISDICSELLVLEDNHIKLSGNMEDIMVAINEKNPIYMTILEGKEEAIRILKEDPDVLSISIDGNELRCNIRGNRIKEALILEELVTNGVVISSYDRHKGNLEKVFSELK
ncbi:MAG: ABC transporter ATP-binding protein [Lachnospiraceae bacterium]|nr:ABC transporter ATP-binding protein [Lachnospiraceae bacterium]